MVTHGQGCVMYSFERDKVSARLIANGLLDRRERSWRESSESETPLCRAVLRGAKDRLTEL